MTVQVCHQGPKFLHRSILLLQCYGFCFPANPLLVTRWLPQLHESPLHIVTSRHKKRNYSFFHISNVPFLRTSKTFSRSSSADFPHVLLARSMSYALLNPITSKGIRLQWLAQTNQSLPSGAWVGFLSLNISSHRLNQQVSVLPGEREGADNGVEIAFGQ